MSTQSSEPFDPLDRHSAARRRRARRMLTQLRADEREAFLEGLAQLVTPDVSFFLRALAAGLLIGFGFRLDQRALLVALIVGTWRHQHLVEQLTAQIVNQGSRDMVHEVVAHKKILLIIKYAAQKSMLRTA